MKLKDYINKVPKRELFRAVTNMGDILPPGFYDYFKTVYNNFIIFMSEEEEREVTVGINAVITTIDNKNTDVQIYFGYLEGNRTDDDGNLRFEGRDYPFMEVSIIKDPFMGISDTALLATILLSITNNYIAQDNMEAK